MKVFKRENNEPVQWVKEASKLHSMIKKAQVDINRNFPKREYVRPLQELDTSSKIHVIEFLNYDTSSLIRVADLEKMLQLADKLLIEKGNILHTELLNMFTKASDIKKMIALFSNSPHRTYAEAKHLFAQILQNGIWVEEAAMIKKVIQVNKKIESLLTASREECSKGLIEISENPYDAKFIDSGFKKEIAYKFPEIGNRQKHIDILVNKQVLDIRDFEALKSLVEDSQANSCLIPGYEALESLFRSFKWTFDMLNYFSIKEATNNLDALCGKLTTRIRMIRETPEFDKCRDKLSEANNLTCKQDPLSQVIAEVKYILWDIEAHKELAAGISSLKTLETLIEKAPDHPLTTQSSAGIYKNLKTTYARANNWKREVERLIRQASELRSCKGEDFKKRMYSSLPQIEEALSRVYEEYRDGLDQVEELRLLKGQLEHADRVLTMCKCLHKFNTKKKIDHMDYQKAKELFKEAISKNIKLDAMLNEFKNLLKIFNKELKMLKEFYLKVSSKDTHATPNLYEPKFLEYAKSLHDIDKLIESLNKVEEFINFGSFGSIVKTFISDFKKAEANLLAFAKDHRVGDLSSLDTKHLQELAMDFELMKQRMHVRVHSSNLEELARYEWVLQAVNCLRVDKARLEALESLKNSSEIARLEDKEIVQQIKNKARRGKILFDEVQQLINSNGSLTIEDLRDIKQKLDNSDILFKSLKKIVENAYASFQLIERDFQEAKDHSETAYLNTLDELRALLKEIQALKYPARSIEGELRRAIHMSEKILELVNLQRHGEELLVSIQQYIDLGVRCKEVEVVLRHRQLALNFLERPDFSIERMSFQELGVLHKSLVNCLDPAYTHKYYDRLLKRKVNLLMNLEKKSEESPIGLLNIQTLEALQIEVDAKEAFSTSDELDYLNEKVFQARLYREELTYIKEEHLSKCKKVLFNYLDVSEEVKQATVSKRGQEKSSTLIAEPSRAAEKQDKEHNLSEPLEKTERKSLRKSLIKALRNSLIQVFPSLTKEEAVEQARIVEMFLFTQTKSNIEEYKQRVHEYQKLIDKAKGKPFLVQMLISRPISPRLVHLVLEDSSEEFIAVKDELQARRYLRNFDITYGTKKHQSAANKSEEDTLGKRFLPTAFNEVELTLMTRGEKELVKEKPEDRGVSQMRGFNGMEEKISLDKSSIEINRVYEFADADEDGEEHNEGFESAKLDNSVNDFGSSLINNNSLEEDSEEATSHRVVGINAESFNKATAARTEHDISEANGDDVLSHKDFELIDAQKYNQMIAVNRLSTPDPIPASPRPALLSTTSPLDVVFVQQKNRDTLHLCTAAKSHETDRLVSAGRGRHLDKWTVFEGSLRFAFCKKTVADVHLISFSSLRQISKTPLLARECIAFDESLPLDGFEREGDNLKKRITNQEVFLVSGLVHADPKKSKSLSEVRRSRSGAVFASDLGEGSKMYLAGPGEVPPSMRIIFDHLNELERLQCEFVWLLAVDTSLPSREKLEPRMCHIELKTRELQQPRREKDSRHADMEAEASSEDWACLSDGQRESQRALLATK